MIGNFSRRGLSKLARTATYFENDIAFRIAHRTARLLRGFSSNNPEQLSGKRSGAPLLPGEEGGRIAASDTSTGFIPNITNKGGKEVSKEDLAKYISEKAKSEAILFKRDKNYTFNRLDIFRPVLPLESIVGSRTFSKIQAGVWIGLGFGAAWTGWYLVAGVFCFLAAGPIAYLAKSRSILKNRVMLLTLSDPTTWKENQIKLTLTTPFKKIETEIGNIKPWGEYVPILEKARPDFEKVNSPDFEPPSGEVPPGVPLFIEIEDGKGKKDKKMLDLDYLLYRVENFDLLVDVLRGETAEVRKYMRVAKPVAREDELILGGHNIDKVAQQDPTTDKTETSDSDTKDQKK